MRRFSALVAMILLNVLIVCPAFSNEINIGKKLDECLIEYNKINFQDIENAIEALVNLDLKLRKFLREIVTQPDQSNYWKSDYAKLDLEIGHFSDSFEYSGALLDKAYKLNPQSKFRKYTLFSGINTDKYCWVENPRNLESAFQYLKEFPNGPFVADVYMALGGFYWSLYNYIQYQKEDLKNKPHEELKGLENHSTLLQYIKETSKLSIDIQEEQAKTSAIKYFEAFLKLRKTMTPG